MTKEEIKVKILELQTQLDNIYRTEMKEGEAKILDCIKACRKAGLHKVFRDKKIVVEARLTVRLVRSYDWDPPDLVPDVDYQIEKSLVEARAASLASKEAAAMKKDFAAIRAIIAEHGLEDKAEVIFSRLENGESR